MQPLKKELKAISLKLMAVRSMKRKSVPNFVMDMWLHEGNKFNENGIHDHVLPGKFIIYYGLK